MIDVYVKKLSKYIIASLILHFVLLFVFLHKKDELPKKEKVIPISLVKIPLKDIQLPEDPKFDKPIVNPSTYSNDEVPEEPNYLSEKNNTVEEETVNSQQEASAGSGQVGQEAPKDRPPEEINLFPDSVISGVAGDYSGGGSGNSGDGDGHSNDVIKGVKEGEATALNTVEFKYASFFNRVKRDVSVFWRPLSRLYQVDPTGEKYLYKDRRTIVFVVLDTDGNLLSVQVARSSEVDVLDDEAIKAFERCRQFPNPPSGLIKGGVISFYFGFEVSRGRRGSILW